MKLGAGRVIYEISESDACLCICHVYHFSLANETSQEVTDFYGIVLIEDMIFNVRFKLLM